MASQKTPHTCSLLMRTQIGITTTVYMRICLARTCLQESSIKPCLLGVAFIILSAVCGARRCALPRRGRSRHVGRADWQPVLRRVRRQARQLRPRDAGELPQPHPRVTAPVALAQTNCTCAKQAANMPLLFVNVLGCGCKVRRLCVIELLPHPTQGSEGKLVPGARLERAAVPRV